MNENHTKRNGISVWPPGVVALFFLVAASALIFFWSIAFSHSVGLPGPVATFIGIGSIVAIALCTIEFFRRLKRDMVESREAAEHNDVDGDQS